MDYVGFNSRRLLLNQEFIIVSKTLFALMYNLSIFFFLVLELQYHLRTHNISFNIN